MIISPQGVPDFSITDWSRKTREELRDTAFPPNLPMHNVTIPGGIFSTAGGMFHSELWKLVTTMGPLGVQVTRNGYIPTLNINLTLRACVPRPFLLVVGSGTINSTSLSGKHFYNIWCNNCVLTNCWLVTLPLPSTSPTIVFVTMQPPYMLLPVEVEGPWYANYGYQFALEMQLQLKRIKRFLGLLIAGIAALVALIATATVALSSSVPKCSYCRTCKQFCKKCLICLSYTRTYW